mgnify:CR=1 FL=1
MLVRMDSPLSRIFFQPSSATRFIHLSIFQELKKNHKTTIHLYCSTQQDVRFYNQYKETGVVDTVNQVHTLYQNISTNEFNEEDILRKAKQHEARLQCTYNHLAVSDRHLGRGYALGGFGHPRSRYSELTSYSQMINAYNETLDYWETQISKYQPTLFVGGGKIISTLARAHGVPYRFLAGSRYKNYFYWAWDEYFSLPNLEEIFVNSTTETSSEIQDPYHNHVIYRNRFIKDLRIARVFRSIILIMARRIYWRLRNYEKGKGYYLSEELLYLIRRWRDGRRLTADSMKTLNDLSDSPFVYYPLHTEPETALQTLSPEYFYQLSCIAALSRDLPVGVKLVVKETIAATGRRPKDFYKQIKEFKNVELLDVTELGLEVVRKAKAIATITGTGGFEAAIMGKPVISFGRHNLYNFLVRLEPTYCFSTLLNNLK